MSAYSMCLLCDKALFFLCDTSTSPLSAADRVCMRWVLWFARASWLYVGIRVYILTALGYIIHLTNVILLRRICR